MASSRTGLRPDALQRKWRKAAEAGGICPGIGRHFVSVTPRGLFSDDNPKSSEEGREVALASIP